MTFLEAERINNRKGIMAVLEPILEIHTWRGMLIHLQVNKYPLRYEGKTPYFFKHELEQHIHKIITLESN